MNNEITPAQNARHMMSTTDHEPKMNQLIRGLLWIGSWLATLVAVCGVFAGIGACWHVYSSHSIGMIATML